MQSEFLMHLFKIFLISIKAFKQKFKFTVYNRHVEHIRQNGKDVLDKTVVKNNGSADLKVDVNKLNRYLLTLCW